MLNALWLFSLKEFLPEHATCHYEFPAMLQATGFEIYKFRASTLKKSFLINKLFYVSRFQNL
jgi:hypothetical protein